MEAANRGTHVRLPGVYKEGCGVLQARLQTEITGKMMKSGWDGGKAAVCREIARRWAASPVKRLAASVLNGCDNSCDAGGTRDGIGALHVSRA